MCVDKPLAENLREAEQLVGAGRAEKLTLMVGFNRRFAPLYRDLKTQLAPQRLYVWISTVRIALGRTICVSLCWTTICT